MTMERIVAHRLLKTARYDYLALDKCMGGMESGLEGSIFFSRFRITWRETIGTGRSIA